MEILEAFDLTKSYRGAAQLCGVDHHTVAAKVAARTAGLSVGEGMVRPSMAEPFADKIVEWVAQSQGLVRAEFVNLCRSRHRLIYADVVTNPTRGSC